MSRGNILIVALCLVVITFQSQRAIAVYYVESQTFNSSASAATDGWATQDTLLNGNNYGFSNSINAGGPAGEAGGTFARSGGENRYADTTIGGTYDRTTDGLFAFGKFSVGPIPNSALGGIEVGFRSADGSAGTNRSFLGMYVIDNNNTTSARVAAAIELANGTMTFGSLLVVPLGVAYDFSFTYSAGTVTLVVPQGTSSVTVAAAAGETFNAFGLGNQSLNNVPAQAGDLFIDNVTYGVPEPTSLGLVTMGAVMCVRRRR